MPKGPLIWGKRYTVNRRPLQIQGYFYIIRRDTSPSSGLGRMTENPCWGLLLCAMTPSIPSPTYKKYLTLNQQLALIKSRGMYVDLSDHDAVAHLERYGYYRLSGYWYPFRELDPNQNVRLDSFQPDTCLSTIFALAAFDGDLRNIILQGIELVESMVRTQIALRLGVKAPDAHLRQKYFNAKFVRALPGKAHSRFERFQQDLADRYRNASDDFVKHHINKRGGLIPIWVSVEVWTFGMISKVFEGLPWADQRSISSRLGYSDPQILVAGLQALNFVRNIAAHHGRLWNRAMVNMPKVPLASDAPNLSHLSNSRQHIEHLYGTLALLIDLLRKGGCHQGFLDRLKNRLLTFPQSPHIDLTMAGFPSNWQSEPLWQP